MHDNPKPTEEEQELAQEGSRQQEEDAMRGAGHDDPEQAVERSDGE